MSRMARRPVNPQPPPRPERKPCAACARIRAAAAALLRNITRRGQQ